MMMRKVNLVPSAGMFDSKHFLGGEWMIVVMVCDLILLEYVVWLRKSWCQPTEKRRRIHLFEHNWVTFLTMGIDYQVK